MKQILAFTLLVSFVLSACGAPATGASQPTAAPSPAATEALQPTAAPSPQPTAEPSPTPIVNPVPKKLLSDVQAFKDKGYIPTSEGKYVRLGDFSSSLSKRGYLNIRGASLLEVTSFVYSGHLKVSTAAPTSETSACGVFFGFNERGDLYAALLDKSRIYFSSADGVKHQYAELGKTSGSGKVSLGDPFEADYTVVVNETYAYVFVNGELIGEYTLSKDKSVKGALGYGIISGTNKDYGTRCEATDASVWLVGATDTGSPADTPVLDTVTQSEFVSGSNARSFEDLAPEQYQDSDFAKPGTFKYTLSLSAGAQALKWSNAWCTKTNAQLKDNLDKIQFRFELDGKEVPLTSFATDTSDACQEYYVTLRDWAAGKYHFVATTALAADVNDGWATYPAGEYIYDYVITVRP